MSGLTYSVYNPTGNVTILVSTPVPVPLQPETAAELMRREPAAEQVGFLSAGADGADISLRMAGGEFCGNASLCAGAHCFFQTGKQRLLVRVSGSDELIPVSLAQTERSCLTGCVQMPAPLSVSPISLSCGDISYSFTCVRFPGITHLVTVEALPKSMAENAIRRWCEDLKAESLGIMLYQPSSQSLTPLVWVPAADTLFWESSCASGTTAVGAALAAQTGGVISVPLQEPGGILTISADGSGRLTLSGSVQHVRTVTLPEASF